MSNSRPLNSDKTEIPGTTIGFRFYANEEELEEVQLKEDSPDVKDAKDVKEENGYFKMVTDILKPEVLDGGKVLVDNRDPSADAPKDQRHLLGKRAISVDSASESSFSNPIETWKKFSEFKEKITKTVEEKISEMKMDRSVLAKTKLTHSKENSSISDSEDTSESSKISEQWKDAENQISSTEKTSDENLGTIFNTLDTSDKKEVGSNEADNELRNRKSTTFSELLNLHDIKIAVAKNEEESSILDDTISDDVESGVEAEEHLNAEESESMDLFDPDPLVTDGIGSYNPPFGDHFGSGLISVVLSHTNTMLFLVLFFLYLYLPLPEFVKGCLLSFLVMFFWGSVKKCMEDDDIVQQPRPFVIPDYKSMPPLKVPKIEISKGVWFNEYEEETYDPDYYSVTQTVPVYLELQGSTLKVSRAKGKIRRRATFDEPEYKLPIIGKRIFNIQGCRVYLMPEGLTRKRLFSKKYPIVIFLKRDSLISETKNGKEVEEKELQDCYESEAPPVIKAVSPKNKCTLFLFARCDRQKEEWYRRLLAATKASAGCDEETRPVTAEPSDVQNDVEKPQQDESPPKEASTPFENICLVDEVNVLEEYFHYMATFANIKSQINEIDSEEMKDAESTGSTAAESQIQWFNAFVNRILFDVFRSPYWLSKIQEKVQRKMNSIRMPYYIEDIEVIEMDLGKTGPVFHRVSLPHLDDRGLWFDMDLTFNGLIRVTIQTQLNLIKLQKGAEECELQSGTPTPPSPTAHSKEKKRKKSEREPKPHRKVSTEMSKGTEKQDRGPSKTYNQPTSQEVIPQKVKVRGKVDRKRTRSRRAHLMCEVTELAEIALEEVSEVKKKAYKDPVSTEPKNRSPIYDSDVEDSAESSSEEEEESEGHHHIHSPTSDEPHSYARRYPRNRRSSKRIFKVFENVAQSKYFRSMAQSKYIQKAIAGVSAAKLRLTLEIKSCTGILVINIPPPPSDRFWYGFREMPTLIFTANPKIGDKPVRFIHIRNYLQKKILYELKKVMVAPNMIDFVLPTSAPAQGSSFVQNEEPDRQEETIFE